MPAYLFAIIFLLASPLYAETGSFHSVRYVRCYDGDTCTVIVPYLPDPFKVLHIRLAGIDAPEIRGKCEREKELAERARLLVNDLLRHATTIDLEHMTPADIYGRYTADIIVNEHISVSKKLLEVQLAVPSMGSRTHEWCEQKG